MGFLFGPFCLLALPPALDVLLPEAEAASGSPSVSGVPRGLAAICSEWARIASLDGAWPAALAKMLPAHWSPASPKAVHAKASAMSLQ